MSLETDIQREPEGLERRLASLYRRWGLRYLLGVLVLWWLGFEAIYGNPTPFYALFVPAFHAFLTPFTMLGVFWLAILVVFWRTPGARGPWRAYGLPALWLCYMLLVVAPVAWVTFSPSMPWRIPPSEVWQELRMHLLVLAIFLLFLGGLYAVLRRTKWFDEDTSPRLTACMLVGMIVFCFAFSGAVAMLRDGTMGIAGAYSRFNYEYTGDIGFGGSLHGLFAEYVSNHKFLSIHAKVHPPGPIAILWILSLGLQIFLGIEGRDPLSLSLATMVVGSLAVVPLYFWVKDLLGRRAALTACLLYVVMPSIVLFTATSADILFMPFTILTLFLFGRALDRASIPYAVGAGILYAMTSLISFSLLSLGVYFGLMGLLRLRDKNRRFAVLQTAVVMLVGFLGLHIAVCLWSGFDMVAAFRAAKAQFDLDQVNLEVVSPRAPSWAWKFLNPLDWLYFAGIPVSVLFFWRMAKPEAATKALFIVFALTLVGLDLLYLARGEGERSAMYILPFLLVPAAHAMDRLGQASSRVTPLMVTLAALAFQCWFTETFFYTYW